MFYLFPFYCFSQIGVNNAFDSRDVYNYYFEESKKDVDRTSIKGNPYFTSLIDGYRYNSYLDVIVNSEDQILTTSKIKLGDFVFVKKEFFVRWKKKKTAGFLIDLGNNSFLRVKKNIREDYNPRQIKKTTSKFEEKLGYFKLIDGEIRQVKKNMNSKRHFFFQIGYINSNLNNYLNENLKNRNSIYYGFGRSYQFMNLLYVKGLIFFSKNGGFNRYNRDNEIGKKIILYNTIGMEILIQKQLKYFNLFAGIRSHYAIKNEERKASRRVYGIRFQDEYTYLDDQLKRFTPISIPTGISLEVKEDIYFEVKYNFGFSKINKNFRQKNKTYLNTFQLGFMYQL